MGATETLIIGFDITGQNILNRCAQNKMGVNLLPVNSEDALVCGLQELTNTINCNCKIILVGDLSETVCQKCVLSLTTYLSVNVKEFYVLAVLPLQADKPEKRKKAEDILRSLLDTVPKYHIKLFDMAAKTKGIIDAEKKFYDLITEEYLLADIKYILENKTLYRFYDFDTDSANNDLPKFPKFDSISTANLVSQLNSIWRKRTRYQRDTPSVKELCEFILIELAERGLRIMPQNIFVNEMKSDNEEISKLLEKLNRVRIEKNRLVELKEYEQSARVRDLEKRLVEEIVNLTFGKEQHKHFNLLGRQLIYRNTGFSFLDEFVINISY